jgi:phage shock protein PspC (stress-responsive transcriptional regulator)
LRRSHFDRLYESRRNKKFRNITLAIMAVCGLLAAILGLDPVMSGEPLRVIPFLGFTLVFFVSTGLSVYFHLKYLSRD